jgi:hypothetical protein
MIVFLCLVAYVALWRARSYSLSPSLPMELSATTLRSDEEGSVPLLFNSVCEDNRGGDCTSVTVVEEEVNRGGDCTSVTVVEEEVQAGS